jgi:hypothetical protein
MAALPVNLSFSDAAALLSATADLKLVTSITSAIRAADIASGRPQPAAFIGPAPNPLGGRRIRDDVYEPRRVITPSPVYLPRPVIRPSPYFEPCPPKCCCPPLPDSQPLAPALPEGTPVARFKIQPPWKTLPWENPPPAEPKPKVVIQMIDKDHRGQMIDLFI